MGKIEDNIPTPEDVVIDASVNIANDVDVNNSALPTKTSAGFWASLKEFLLLEVEEDNFWFKKIVLEPAPIVNGKQKSFLFRNITLK